MDASFGADRQRWKPRLGANFIGDELVDGDVAVAPVLGFVVQHAREKRVDGEMPAPQSVIESAIDRDLVAVCGQRLEQRRFFKAASRRFREKMFLLKAEQVAHRDEPASTGTRTACRPDRRVATGRLGHQRWQPRQSKGSGNGLNDETAAIKIDWF